MGRLVRDFEEGIGFFEVGLADGVGLMEIVKEGFPVGIGGLENEKVGTGGLDAFENEGTGGLLKVGTGGFENETGGLPVGRPLGRGPLLKLGSSGSSGSSSD